MRYGTRHFHGKFELPMRGIAPSFIGPYSMSPVERGIDLHAGKMLRIVHEVRLGGATMGALRRRVAPTGDAYVYTFHGAQCGVVHGDPSVRADG